MGVAIKESISNVAAKLAENYKTQGIFEMGNGEKLPKRNEIIDLVKELQRVMFPGYFGTENTAYVSLENFAGNTLAAIYEKMNKQIKVALAYMEQNKEKKKIKEQAENLTLAFMEKIPHIQELLWKDVEAEFEGDPAANSKEEIIFCYPGILAIFPSKIKAK